MANVHISGAELKALPNGLALSNAKYLLIYLKVCEACILGSATNFQYVFLKFKAFSIVIYSNSTSLDSLIVVDRIFRLFQTIAFPKYHQLKLF